MLYKVPFTRINGSFSNDLRTKVIRQEVDIVVEFDADVINYDNMHEFEEKAWEEFREQLPHWRDYSPPKYCYDGWSTVIMGRSKFEALDGGRIEI